MKKKKKATDWENQTISDIETVYRIYKVHSITRGKSNNNLSKAPEYFTKEDIKMANKHRKDVQYHESFGKFMLKA